MELEPADKIARTVGMGHWYQKTHSITSGAIHSHNGYIRARRLDMRVSCNLREPVRLPTRGLDLVIIYAGDSGLLNQVWGWDGD